MSSNDLAPVAPPPPPALTRPPRRWIHAAVALVAVAATVGSLVAWRASAAAKSDKKAEPEKSFEFTASDLVRLAPRELGRVIPVSGSINPVLWTTLRSKLAAEVARIHVQEGERVAPGQVLLTLDAADLRARLNAQLAAQAEAQARLNLALKNQSSQRQLLSQNFISQNAFDSAQSGVEVAQAALDAAAAQAEIARRALGDTQVRAPFGGVVAKRLVSVGEKLSPDVALLQLVDLSQMELQAPLPVSEIPFIQVGQALELSVDGFERRVFKAKVGRINPSVEPGTRAIFVSFALANADSALKGGMFGKGHITLSAGASVNTLPLTAIHEEAGQTFVFTLKEGQLERRPVLLGQRREELGLVEVRDGPAPGVDVVAVKTEGLQHGLKASVKSTQR